MIWVFFSVMFVLLGLFLLFLGKRTYESTNLGGDVTVNFRKWAIIPVGIGILLFLPGMAYTQDPGEAVVIKSFTGSVKGIDTSSGLGWKLPWDSNIGFDIRNQRIEMFSNAGGEGKDGSVIVAPLQGSSNAYVSITVRYSIVPDSVRSIYEQYKNQDNLLNTALRPSIRDVVREATAEYPPFEVKERRADLTATIQDRLSADWGKYGVIVDNVDLGDLSLDEKTEESLRQVNQRQADVESARADLERAYIQAETTKTDAQAQADADQIIRCGATTTTETRDIAGKPEQVTVIIPKEGEACENRINEQVLLRNLVEVYGKLAESGQLVIKDGDTLLTLPPVGTPNQ